VDVTNHIPLWLTILLISRDIVIVAVVAIVNLAVGPRTFRPSFLGKMATATYIVVSVAFMYFNWRQETSWIVDAAVYAALALTLVSSADYFFRMRRLINEGH
jgi:cardiolipin synthase